MKRLWDIRVEEGWRDGMVREGSGRMMLEGMEKRWEDRMGGGLIAG